MTEFVNGPYTTKRLKEQLNQHYSTSIVIAKRNGCEDVIYFKNSVNSL